MQQIMWYVNAGGLLMWPLLACLALVLGVILERLFVLRRSAVLDAEAIDDLQKLAEAGEAKRAVEKHQSSPALLIRVISKALSQHLTLGIPIERTLHDVGQRDLPSLANHLNLLATIVRVAPLLGLLGTVVGMIVGFDALEKAGVGKAQLAGAIRIALVTTATGLLVAIPGVVAVSYFRSRIRRYQAQFEEILPAVARSVRAGEGKTRPEDAPMPKPDRDEEHFELPSILSGRG